MPKVSVVIPNYNHATYLKQRIDSVLNQTYTNFELIILDDCSTDNSRSIIELYKNELRISKIIYNDVNSGNPFLQWDKGIQLTKGEYIWIAESDDWCEPNLLEILVKALEGNHDCAISYCQSYCVNNAGQIIFQSNHTSLGEYVKGKDFISHYIVKRNPIFNAGMAVWRKKVYTEITKEYINYKLTGDYFFWLELSNYGDVFISGRLLNYFRQHQANVSFGAARSGLRFIEQIPGLKKLFEKKLIKKNDYLSALKKLYLEFKKEQKSMSAQNAAAIKKLFENCTQTPYKLRVYFLQKSVQSFSRKLLRS